jgi:hypothetical protein
MRSIDEIFDLMPELTPQTALDELRAILPKLTVAEVKVLREFLDTVVQTMPVLQ